MNKIYGEIKYNDSIYLYKIYDYVEKMGRYIGDCYILTRECNYAHQMPQLIEISEIKECKELPSFLFDEMLETQKRYVLKVMHLLDNERGKYRYKPISFKKGQCFFYVGLEEIRFCKVERIQAISDSGSGVAFVREADEDSPDYEIHSETVTLEKGVISYRHRWLYRSEISPLSDYPISPKTFEKARALCQEAYEVIYNDFAYYLED